MVPPHDPRRLMTQVLKPIFMQPCSDKNPGFLTSILYTLSPQPSRSTFKLTPSSPNPARLSLLPTSPKQRRCRRGSPMLGQVRA